MSTEVGPQPKLGQRLESTAEADKVAGSRSAPIGTSPRANFPLIYQRVEADRQWGPTSVLIHKSLPPESCPATAQSKKDPDSPFLDSQLDSWRDHRVGGFDSVNGPLWVACSRSVQARGAATGKPGSALGE